MLNVVPVALQRLRAADIIWMAGLATASVGQEYSRANAVHHMRRSGALLSGVVDSPQEHNTSGATIEPLSFVVEVEIVAAREWKSNCTCGAVTTTLCAHGAALLYCWLAKSVQFNAVSTDQPPDAPTPKTPLAPTQTAQPVQTTVTDQPSSATGKDEKSIDSIGPVTPHESISRENKEQLSSNELKGSAEPTPSLAQRYASSPLPVGGLSSLLAQLTLSDLRALAREYDLATSGLSRQQIVEVIYNELLKADVVRRIAGTLEKSQRQLLAAIILVGGALSDDDLRGLFERFGLGQPSQLQQTLLILQGKALLFRSSMNASQLVQSSRVHSSFDIGWLVPAEVRSALRVTVPVTPFDVTAGEGESTRPVIALAEPSDLLGKLFLIARVLDGHALRGGMVWYEKNEPRRSMDIHAPLRTPGARATDGSIAIPAPEDLPPDDLLHQLQPSTGLSAPLLRFALQMLRLSSLLQKDDAQPAVLHLQSEAAELLLGDHWAKMLRQLFERWLTQASYVELYELSEERLRLRCRATSLQQPVFRPGELEGENSQVRQGIVGLLTQVPLNQWINFSSFARFVYRLNPLFLQRRQRLSANPQWWIELEEGRLQRPLQLNEWLRADIFYLTHLLTGPLHWLGICDLASNAEGRLLAFRLTPLAGCLLRNLPHMPDNEQKTDNGDPYHVSSLQVADTLHMLVSSSVANWPLIRLLEIFTEPEDVQQGLLRYHLSPGIFGQALSKGLHPAPLLELLRRIVVIKAATEPQQAQLLEQLTTRLAQWQASYRQVRIYTGVTLLETVDTAVMREVLATTSLEERIVQNIHPTLTIIKPEMIAPVIEELKQRGQSPLLHEEDL